MIGARDDIVPGFDLRIELVHLLGQYGAGNVEQPENIVFTVQNYRIGIF